MLGTVLAIGMIITYMNLVSRSSLKAHIHANGNTIVEDHTHTIVEPPSKLAKYFPFWHTISQVIVISWVNLNK